MAENSQVRTKARRKTRTSSAPMSSDRMYNIADPTGLISPPPEETLQMKRKRTTPQPQQTTPNPKPRKQSRRPSVLESPTRPAHRSPAPSNPNADYLPTRTRRTTPIPTYEPPTDVFTPPRVVVMTPTISKSSKRKTSRKRAELFIKTEPPQIDLSAPMPPPSPTDDPLLLSAPSSSPVRRRTRDASVSTLPPSSPPMDIDSHPLFDVTDPSVGVWSDSDDGNVSEGEYTGTFRSFSVRTKLDPPSSATRERQEEWGRPITPFPFRKIGPLQEEDEPDVAMEQGTPTRPADDENEEERQVRELSLPLDEQPALAQAAPEPEPPSRGPFDFDASFEEDAPGPQEELPPVEEQPIMEEDREETAQAQSITMEEAHEETDSQETPIDDMEQEPIHNEEDEEADEREVREMSFSLDDDEDPTVIATPAPQLEADQDQDSSSDEEELEYGVVKISSADPHAAARAAAILKQHDYDCFTKLALRGQKERHSLSASGITKTKTRSPHDRLRRRTLGASIIGDKVFIPGSPVTTLPELLKEAEATVAGTPAKFDTTSHLFTPVPRSGASTAFGLARSLFENVGKEKVWTKEEWKLLDACFTDERIALGPGDGQLASVDRVHPEDVARRFVDLLGGDDVVNKLGEDWETENLVQRVKALQNKQRKGIVAPPTTPTTPRSSLTNPSTSLFTRRLASMEVPDFTPLGRRAPPPGRRPMLPPPVVAGAPFSDLQDTPEQEPKRKLPLSLLAPRYSHLLEEAVAVSQLPDPEPKPDNNDVNAEEAEDAETEAVLDTSTETPEAEPEPISPPSPAPTEPLPTSTSTNPAPPSTLKTRVKGFLFSYLPTLSKTSTSNPNPKPSTTRPGLPLPPPSVLEKSRGPICTPTRAPVPKPTHPKELVRLHPAPVSMIPRPRPQRPQRLVELHRVSPPPEREKEREVVRPRRSSGSSVKDLVRGFEEMEKSASVSAGVKGGELKRVRSVGEWRKTAGLANVGAGKPSWRP